MLLLSGCNLFPEPSSLIHVPNHVKTVEGSGQNIFTIAIRNLPKGTALSVPNGPVGTDSVIAADIDGDGQDEIIVLYRSLNNPNQVGTFILKKGKKYWEKVFAKKGTGYEISWASVADLTGDGKNEVLFGWQAGVSAGNTLEIYSWKKNGLERIDELNYHELEAIQFEHESKVRLAVWNRDLADVYKIQLLMWDGNKLIPDDIHYPAYFQKVINYYKHRTAEVPDAAYYWYYLADAYLKAGHPELALGAVDKGMKLKTVVPSYRDFDNLKKLIEEQNKALRNKPFRFELTDPDLSFEVPRKLAPYITAKGNQGELDSYDFSIDYVNDKKSLKELFTIAVYPREMLENMSITGLDKIGETSNHVYFVKKGPALFVDGKNITEQLITSIKIGSIYPKFISLEDQMVINMLKTASNKYWYVMSGGKMPEGPVKTININGAEFRYMGSDLDTNIKLKDFLSDVYTSEAIQAFKNRATIFDYFGKLLQPNADGGSRMNNTLAKVIQKKDNGSEKEFDIKVPLGNSFNFEVVHIGFQKTEKGWRIFSEPGSF